MDVIKRIDDLMKERGWTDYKLSSMSGLSTSTIANIHRRNTTPSISTLESICSAFGITLSQFFSENQSASRLTHSQTAFLAKWDQLSSKQKRIIRNIIDEFES